MAGETSRSAVAALTPERRDVLIDKIRGIAIGNALGDTIGLYTEFMVQDQMGKAYPKPNFSLVEPVTPLHIDAHRARFEERAWTDDTDQLLLILLSYLHNNGELTQLDFAQRLQDWIRQGLRCLDRLPLGIGKTVGSVVTDKEFLTRPAEIAEEKWRNVSNCTNAANGAVMRTSIIAAMYVNKSREECYQATYDIAAVTHADPRCLVSCIAVVGLLHAILNGELTKEEQIDGVLQHAWDWMPKKEILNRDQREYQFDPQEYWGYCKVDPAKEWNKSFVVDDRAMGYTYISLGTSVWCLRRAMKGMGDFKSVITKLIMYGGDADTNAAVAGALVGAYCGYNGLPAEWRDGLKYREWLLQKIEAMCIINGVITDKTYDGKKDADTQLDGGVGFLSEEEMKKKEADLWVFMSQRMEAKRQAERAKSKSKSAKNLWGLLD